MDQQRIGVVRPPGELKPEVGFWHETDQLDASGGCQLLTPKRPDFDAGKITQHLFVAVRIAGALASASALLLPGAAGPRRLRRSRPLAGLPTGWAALRSPMLLQTGYRQRAPHRRLAAARIPQ